MDSQIQGKSHTVTAIEPHSSCHGRKRCLPPGEPREVPVICLSVHLCINYYAEWMDRWMDRWMSTHHIYVECHCLVR